IHLCDSVRIRPSHLGCNREKPVAKMGERQSFRRDYRLRFDRNPPATASLQYLPCANRVHR
ncbi:hypothetical protein KXW47_009368, partial [Aspergillus fumigatus]